MPPRYTTSGRAAPYPGFAIAALTRTRAELAGEIEGTQARLDQGRSDLVHQVAAVRLPLPIPWGYPELIPPKKPAARAAAGVPRADRRTGR